MAQVKTLGRQIRRWIFLMLLVGVYLIPAGPAWSEPTPLTPAAAKYELEHAGSVEAAGQRIQQRSQDYQAELAKSPTPIPNAAKQAERKTQGLWQRFQQRVQETLTPDAPQPTGERS